jgi:DNA-binding IscR family transcriptional regulator
VTEKKEWTFLSAHGRVFVYIANHPRDTAQEIAERARLSIRAVQLIIADLEKSGYIIKHREGRNNCYTVRPELPMRHQLESEHSVGDILLALGHRDEQQNMRTLADSPSGEKNS